jgi:hypothetical protein
MDAKEPPRLAARYMEDLAYFTLTARADSTELNLYPEIADDARHRLRVRTKQMSRYDWPSHVGEDPALRRGYTLRQCFRLMIVLQMVDAHLPPSLAVRVARNNELGLMDVIAARLNEPERLTVTASDAIAIMLPGELRDLLPSANWPNSLRLQFVARGDLADLWTGAPGTRLAMDIGAAAAGVWRWLSGRRLFDESARIHFLGEIAELAAQPRYANVPSRDRPKA